MDNLEETLTATPSPSKIDILPGSVTFFDENTEENVNSSFSNPSQENGGENLSVMNHRHENNNNNSDDLVVEIRVSSFFFHFGKCHLESYLDFLLRLIVIL